MKRELSDGKETTNEQPTTFVISEPAGKSLKSRLTKKHVLIGVISLLVTGLVVTAVLVSVRMVMDNNLAVLKYSMNSNGVQQNVSTSENSVMYSVTKDNVQAWIVQDFDKGLQISKVLVDGQTTCYVTALNRSAATDPSSIPTTAPTVKDSSSPTHSIYKVLPDKIPEISFLGKRGSALCQNIPTYHAVPDCSQPAKADSSMLQGNSSAVGQRSKRSPAICAIYQGHYCYCGCCWMVCGSFRSYSYVCYYLNGYWYCTYYMNYVTAYGWLGNSKCWYNGRYYLP